MNWSINTKIEIYNHIESLDITILQDIFQYLFTIS